MRKPKRISDKTRFVLLWLLAVGLEVPVLAQIAEQGLAVPPFWVVCMHLAGACAMFLAPPREKGWFQPTRHWAEPLGLLALLVPGAGSLFGGVLFLRHPVAHHDKEAYRFDDEEEDTSSWLASLGTPSAIRQELSEVLDVVPAVDALVSHDPAFKRGAIEILAKMRSPEAIGWIIRARKDRDPETRFYATSALSRLQSDFDNAIHAAEREMFKRPGDFTAQLALHRIRYDYARSGLLESATSGEMLRQARAWLAAPAERDREALRLLYLVERQLDPAQALATLDRLAKADPDQSVRWLWEKTALLFEMGRYGEARKIMFGLRAELLKADVPETEPELAQWRTAALWWTDA
ncbi:MAG: hypothetical protein A2V88_03430 [Elusimicrobia bacterium RBG_16_66_12]|nr:MAG: hypothetical protein A2V88_03430 [Elusimicrobia bacterium RBG_16_66_12]